MGAPFEILNGSCSLYRSSHLNTAAEHIDDARVLYRLTMVLSDDERQKLLEAILLQNTHDTVQEYFDYLEELPDLTSLIEQAVVAGDRQLVDYLLEREDTSIKDIITAILSQDIKGMIVREETGKLESATKTLRILVDDYHDRMNDEISQIILCQLINGINLNSEKQVKIVLNIAEYLHDEYGFKPTNVDELYEPIFDRAELGASTDRDKDWVDKYMQKQGPDGDYEVFHVCNPTLRRLLDWLLTFELPSREIAAAQSPDNLARQHLESQLRPRQVKALF